MKPLFTLSFILLCTGLLLPPARAQQPPRKMDLYLLIGQSNMAGRGKLPADNPPRDGIWVIDSTATWVPARDPLHFDKPVAGVGPGLTFAEEIYKRAPQRAVGLIPCAVGGSTIDDWQPGARHAQTGIYPYDAMLKRVKTALANGKIKAVLWHQGEGDSTPERSKVYGEKLAAFFERLRNDLDLPRVPILIGTLGDFYVAKNRSAETINKIISAFPEHHDRFYVVSSAGLTHLSDKTHFDTPSAQELGRRYAEALLATRSGRKQVSR